MATLPPWLVQWLQAQTALDFLIWVAGIVSLALGLILVFRKVVPFVRRMGHFLDDWIGEEARDGHPARPGVMVRLQSIETVQEAQTRKLDAVHHEVFPNSGKSLRDRTDQTSHVVRAMARELGMDPDDLEDTTPTKEKR